jgi:hypothetical protein
MTCGQICYGFLFEADTEFPWSDSPWNGDHEAWWRDVKGHEPLEYPYTEYGEYKPGYSKDDPRIEEYFRHRVAWTQENPFPVEMVEYCGYDESMVILAIPSTLRTCELGSPFGFKSDTLKVTSDELQALIHFCSEHGIEFQQNCQWWLSCYRG